MSKKSSSPKYKTNAVRMIESAGIGYELREYEAPDGFLDGFSDSDFKKLDELTCGSGASSVFAYCKGFGSPE